MIRISMTPFAMAMAVSLVGCSMMPAYQHPRCSRAGDFRRRSWDRGDTRLSRFTNLAAFYKAIGGEWVDMSTARDAMASAGRPP
jgi:hypothetical protein